MRGSRNHVTRSFAVTARTVVIATIILSFNITVTAEEGTPATTLTTGDEYITVSARLMHEGEQNFFVTNGECYQFEITVNAKTTAVQFKGTTGVIGGIEVPVTYDLRRFLKQPEVTVAKAYFGKDKIMQEHNEMLARARDINKSLLYDRVVKPGQPESGYDYMPVDVAYDEYRFKYEVNGEMLGVNVGAVPSAIIAPTNQPVAAPTP